MGHIFYLIGIFVFLTLLFNIYSLSNYYKTRYWINTFKKVTKNEPKPTEFRNKKEYEIYLAFSACSIFQFFWYLIGITSASWYIFGSIILVNFLANLIIFSLPQSLIGKTILGSFILLKILILLLLILNHFHFHYDWLLLFN